jgi:alpha-glucosidase (family GH31 glycosyl hydrolase)
MFGSHIVTADLGFKDGAAHTENSSSVALPPGKWYMLNSTATVQGDTIHTETDLAITDFPVYVREGAVLTLNKDKVQWSEAQGGALEVQVYAGADGAFTLYEDDGTSLDYRSESKKDAAVRKRPPSSSSSSSSSSSFYFRSFSPSCV